MLKQAAWMIAGGIAAALAYGASRVVARWRTVNFIGPRQFVGALEDEGEHELAGRLRAALGTKDFPDLPDDPDPHEGAGIG